MSEQTVSTVSGLRLSCFVQKARGEGLKSGSYHVGDAIAAVPVTTLLGSWRCEVSARTGWHGVSVLQDWARWQLMCNSYLNVAVGSVGRIRPMWQLDQLGGSVPCGSWISWADPSHVAVGQIRPMWQLGRSVPCGSWISWADPSHVAVGSAGQIRPLDALCSLQERCAACRTKQNSPCFTEVSNA